ncbi:MAG TPA: hypothetical protein VF283_08675 [Bryobacteraceae bacterium]
MTFVDWAPMPPDKEMGIWRDVSIVATGPAAIRYPAVLTKLNLPSTDRAQLTVRVELQNAKNEPVEESSTTVTVHIQAARSHSTFTRRPIEPSAAA